MGLSRSTTETEPERLREAALSFLFDYFPGSRGQRIHAETNNGRARWLSDAEGNIVYIIPHYKQPDGCIYYPFPGDDESGALALYSLFLRPASDRLSIIESLARDKEEPRFFSRFAETFLSPEKEGREGRSLRQRIIFRNKPRREISSLSWDNIELLDNWLSQEEPRRDWLQKTKATEERLLNLPKESRLAALFGLSQKELKASNIEGLYCQRLYDLEIILQEITNIDTTAPAGFIQAIEAYLGEKPEESLIPVFMEGHSYKRRKGFISLLIYELYRVEDFREIQKIRPTSFGLSPALLGAEEEELYKAALFQYLENYIRFPSIVRGFTEENISAIISAPLDYVREVITNAGKYHKLSYFG